MPLYMGTISALLFAWSIYNERVIWPTLNWDNGVPSIWPYMADILFFVLNAPVFLVVVPVVKLFSLNDPSARYYLQLPPVLMWWWLFGLGLDYGLIRRQVRARWPRFTLSSSSALLAVAGTTVCVLGLRWWYRWGSVAIDGVLFVVDWIAPAMWCFALAIVTGVAARRMTDA